MTTENPASIKRGPGAPLGNTNALKHGFYSRRMRPTDLTDAETYEFTRLKEEIAVLRIFIRRIIELSNNIDNLEVMIPLLRVLNISFTSLSRLIRTEKIVWPGQSTSEIDEIVNSVFKEYQEAKKYWDQPQEEDPAFNLDPFSDDPTTPASDHLGIVSD